MTAAKGSARTPLGPIAAYGCQTPSAQRRSDQHVSRGLLSINTQKGNRGGGFQQENNTNTTHLKYDFLDIV